MALNDSSFMQIDNLISSNVKVGRLLANVPAGTPGAIIDMVNQDGIAMMFSNTSMIISAAEADSRVDLKTSAKAVKFLLNDGGDSASYTIAPSYSGDSFEHATSMACHEFIAGAAGRRLKVGSGADGVSVTSLDAGGALGHLLLEGSAVHIPSNKVRMSSNALVIDGQNVSVGGSGGVVTMVTPTTVRNTLSVQGGNLVVANALVVDVSHSSVGINAIPEAGKALTVGGSVTIAGAMDVGGNITGESARIDGQITADSITSTSANISGHLAVMGSASAVSAAVSGTLSASSVQVTGPATLDTVHVAGAANLSTLSVSGTSSFVSLAASGSADVAGNINVAGRCTIGGVAMDPSNALAVTGNAIVTDAMSVGGHVAAASIVANVAAITGSADVAGDLHVGANLITKSIGTTSSNLALNANVLYFNTNQVMFKGNSYVVNTTTTTYTDKVIRLGDTTNSMYNNSLRNGSGVVLVGAPDNKPEALNGNIHMRWLAAGGVFDSTGNVVAADSRSRWEFAGGNFVIKSVDEKNSYMFSIDNGVLNLYKCALDSNGAQTSSQLVAAFGRNAF